MYLNLRSEEVLILEFESLPEDPSVLESISCLPRS